MKKIYVIAAFLGATSFAFNQVQKAPMHISQTTEKVVNNQFDNQKDPGVTLWTDDFSDASTWVIGGDGQQGTWVIGGLGDLTGSNYYAEIESPTVANGFAFFEGIPFLLAPPVLEQNAWVEMAESVDLSDEEVITFNFTQGYRAFNHDETYVEVSLDGGATWEQSIDVNSTITANNYPTELEVNRNFNVNNSADVKFRFRWSSMTADDSFGSGYAWQVDDVNIRTLADNDVSASAFQFGVNDTAFENGYFPYYQIPLSQVTSFTASVHLTSQGLSDQTNVKLSSEETVVGDYSESTTPVDMQIGDEADVALATGFTPADLGNYTLDYTIESDQVDDVPANNQLSSYSFNVVEDLYARDRSTVAEQGEMVGGSITGADDDPEENSSIEVGNLFIMNAAQTVYGIDFQFGDLISEGSLVFGHILDGELEQLYETEAYVVEAGDANQYKTLMFETPVDLPVGEYVISVTSLESDFSVAAAGNSPAQTTFIFYTAEDTWYYTTSTPVVRMNFAEGTSGIEDEALNLNVTTYPNPFSNETNVKFTTQDASNVSYTIVDLAGQVVANVNAGNLMAGEHTISIDGSSLANGIYYLNLNAGNANVTKKLVVTK